MGEEAPKRFVRKTNSEATPRTKSLVWKDFCIDDSYIQTACGQRAFHISNFCQGRIIGRAMIASKEGEAIITGAGSRGFMVVL
jgi:hypothetical protein